MVGSCYVYLCPKTRRKKRILGLKSLFLVVVQMWSGYAHHMFVKISKLEFDEQQVLLEICLKC